MHTCMDGWMDGSTHGCRDAWMRGCMEMHAVTKEMTTTRKLFHWHELKREQSYSAVKERKKETPSKMLISFHPRDQIFISKRAGHLIQYSGTQFRSRQSHWIFLLFGPTNTPQLEVLLTSMFVSCSTVWMQQKRVCFSFVKLS